MSHVIHNVFDTHLKSIETEAQRDKAVHPESLKKRALGQVTNP